MDKTIHFSFIVHMLLAKDCIFKAYTCDGKFTLYLVFYQYTMQPYLLQDFLYKIQSSMTVVFINLYSKCCLLYH